MRKEILLEDRSRASFRNAVASFRVERWAESRVAAILRVIRHRLSITLFLDNYTGLQNFFFSVMSTKVVELNSIFLY
jgi:hypothetical protein